MTKRAEAENPYQRACALWVAQKTGKDADKITDVNFTVIRGGVCETCAYESTGIEFRYNGHYQEYEFFGDESMAKFLEEAVQLLAEAGAIP